MNIYADRGNLLFLERRCEWRGIGFELTGAHPGDAVDPEAHDLFYLGGGQDRDQALCAQDLATVKRDALHAAADRGAVVFAVCGGHQLLGHSYQLGDETLPGARPRRPAHGPRRRPAADRQRRDRGRAARPRRARASSPASRTTAAARTSARASSRSGASSPATATTAPTATRACAAGNVIGTYLHGPLLPKNAWFADWLIASALGLEPGALAPLDDALEDEAHLAARRAAL